MNLDRLDAATILGARVWIVTIGQTITGGSGENNKVSDTVLPELPESYANPGDWIALGKVRTAKPQTDYKTADVEGVDDTGAYKVTELKMAQKRKLQFSTNDITPEAFQMTFGLTSAIVDGEEQSVFASGNDSLEVWACYEMTDAYRTQTGIARILVRGVLSLQNPLEAKSDLAQADYELSVKPNALAMFVAGAAA
ncbi:MAG: hypothetical protein Q4F35_05075 [Akkermansia sp.]|nr:hypothetical protein [Akkermansia sp.]